MTPIVFVRILIRDQALKVRWHLLYPLEFLLLGANYRKAIQVVRGNFSIQISFHLKVGHGLALTLWTTQATYSNGDMDVLRKAC